MDEKSFGALNSDLEGNVSGISLQSFLQMSDLDKKTCTLEITSRGRVGYLYLINGALVDAETENLDPREAAFRIISWNDPVIRIKKAVKRKNRINLPLMHILMQSQKIKDESEFEAIETPLQAPSAKPLSESAVTRPRKVKPPAKTKLKPTAKKKTGAAGKTKNLNQLAHAHAKKAAYYEKKEKLRRFLRTTATLLITSAVIMAGAIFLGPQIKSMINGYQYRQVLAKVDEKDTIEEKEKLLLAYINHHEESKFTAEALKKIEELRHFTESRDYDLTLEKISALPKNKRFEKEAKEIFKAFISKYPDGLYAKEIKKRIAGIPDVIDDAEFEQVKAISPEAVEERLAACQSYLKNQPRGRHRQEVNGFISEIKKVHLAQLKNEISECEQLQPPDKCIPLCDAALKLYSSLRKSGELDDIIATRERMEDKLALSKLLSAADKTDHEATRQKYIEFINKNPNSTEIESVKDKLAKIELTLRKKKEWEAVYAMSLNKETSVFDRINHIHQYAKKYPESEYIASAKMLLAQLEKEKKVVERRQKREAEKKARAERVQREQEKMTALLKQSGGRFVANEDGSVTDTVSGLMWVIVDSRADLGNCVNYKAAKKYMANLKTGGYTDWRMPTAAELAGIYKSEPFFPDGGTDWYWTSETFAKGYQKMAKIVTTRKETVFKRESEKQDSCGSVRAVRK